jgi:hypothetical protein
MDFIIQIPWAPSGFFWGRISSLEGQHTYHFHSRIRWFLRGRQYWDNILIGSSILTKRERSVHMLVIIIRHRNREAPLSAPRRTVKCQNNVKDGMSDVKNASVAWFCSGISTPNRFSKEGKQPWDVPYNMSDHGDLSGMLSWPYSGLTSSIIESLSWQWQWVVRSEKSMCLQDSIADGANRWSK